MMINTCSIFVSSKIWRRIVKKKRQSPKLHLAQFVAIIALSISIFLVVDFARRAAANYRVQREAERLQEQVDQAHEQQKKLLAKRSYVAGDLYVEDIARKELKWARAGETVVVVMPTSQVAAQTSPPSVEAQSVGPVAQTPVEAWWLTFFGDESLPRYIKATP
jgi:cell division protein FtsB